MSLRTKDMATDTKSPTWQKRDSFLPAMLETMVPLALQQDERGNFPILILHSQTCPLTLRVLRGWCSESLAVACNYFSGLCRKGKWFWSGGSGGEQYYQMQIVMGAIKPHIRIAVSYILTLKTTQFVSTI